MGDLALSYIADIDQELVVMQGISAQITRIRQQRSACRRKSVGALPKPIAVPNAAAALSTHISTWKSMPQIKHTRSRKDDRNGSSAPPSIPLHLLLPKHPRSPTRVVTAPAASMPTPPMSPGCMSVGSRTSSINPRFSDAHVEYIGKDCVIHNGAHTIDIAMEFATQRAAPRLVSFPQHA
ncbi:hypothetical protein LPJ63_004605 [Coemansia sp. RSA 2711]|nr:hypothetical protein LPJ63_004605 [Coemansia sp. RSA 2711]